MVVQFRFSARLPDCLERNLETWGIFNSYQWIVNCSLIKSEKENFYHSLKCHKKVFGILQVVKFKIILLICPIRRRFIILLLMKLFLCKYFIMFILFGHQTSPKRRSKLYPKEIKIAQMKNENLEEKKRKLGYLHPKSHTVVLNCLHISYWTPENCQYSTWKMYKKCRIYTQMDSH